MLESLGHTVWAPSLGIAPDVESAQDAQSLKQSRANMSRIQKERCNHVRACEPDAPTDRPYPRAGQFCSEPCKSFTMRTYEKRARKLFAIRTYKIIGLKVL